jgi:hypothetical protein
MRALEVVKGQPALVLSAVVLQCCDFLDKGLFVGNPAVEGEVRTPSSVSARSSVVPFEASGRIRHKVSVNQGQSVNSGFAVDVWRPNPFNTATHAVTDLPVDHLFEGIQVDVAVRDTDAYIFRLGYNITLLGRIVPTKVIIL